MANLVLDYIGFAVGMLLIAIAVYDVNALHVATGLIVGGFGVLVMRLPGVGWGGVKGFMVKGPIGFVLIGIGAAGFYLHLVAA